MVEAIKTFCRQRADQLSLPVELIPAKPWVGQLLRGWLETGVFVIPATSTDGWRSREVLVPLIEHLNNQNFSDALGLQKPST